MILDGVEPTKFCPDCREDRPVSAFTRNVRSRDGLSFYCAGCARARVLKSRRKRLGPPRSRNGQGPCDVPVGSKWCPECDAVKPTEEFPRNRSQRSGLGTYCKPCHNKIVRASSDAHGGARNYHLRRRYGITAEHFDEMFAEQGGRCAICREAKAEHVDHDHSTGRIRGLLCFNCNGALGQFRDRTELMMRAVAYLKQMGGTPITDHPGVHIGLFIGDPASPRPPDEPRAA